MRRDGRDGAKRERHGESLVLRVQLEIRATDYNRFQEKAEKGSLQIFWWGWFADYPDAENFLFLLYGPNSKALTNGNGENTANYLNGIISRITLAVVALPKVTQ